MKTAIIGSRSLKNLDINKYLVNIKITVIISGGAIGIDTLAKEYAKKNQIPYLEFLPNYQKYGKGATHIRNREIVNNSDVIIAFWDGKSKGTQSIINYAKKQKKEVIIFQV